MFDAGEPCFKDHQPMRRQERERSTTFWRLARRPFLVLSPFHPPAIRAPEIVSLQRGSPADIRAADRGCGQRSVSRFRPWREEHAMHGFLSSLSSPMDERYLAGLEEVWMYGCYKFAPVCTSATVTAPCSLAAAFSALLVYTFSQQAQSICTHSKDHGTVCKRR